MDTGGRLPEYMHSPTGDPAHTLSGYDQASGTIYYTDTNGGAYSMSYDDFKARWDWTDGGISAPILSLLGVRGRTLIA